VLESDSVQRAVDNQTDQLLPERDAQSAGLLAGHCRTDVDVADDLSPGPVELKSENIGRSMVTFVLGVEPLHCLTAEKGYRNQSLAAFSLENGLDHAPDQRTRQR
jgi:hypothetical protein